MKIQTWQANTTLESKLSLGITERPAQNNTLYDANRTEGEDGTTRRTPKKKIDTSLVFNVQSTAKGMSGRHVLKAGTADNVCSADK